MSVSLHISKLMVGTLPLSGQRPPAFLLAALEGGYLEFLDQHSHVLYPVLGVLVLVLIAGGVLQAWRSQDLDGLAKAELKREVILELRRQLGGLTAEDLARPVGLEPFRMNRLLEEMQQDGLLLSHTNTSHKKLWRVKGGPEAARRPKRASRR